MYCIVLYIDSMVMNCCFISFLSAWLAGLADFLLLQMNKKKEEKNSFTCSLPSSATLGNWPTYFVQCCCVPSPSVCPSIHPSTFMLSDRNATSSLRCHAMEYHLLCWGGYVISIHLECCLHLFHREVGSSKTLQIPPSSGVGCSCSLSLSLPPATKLAPAYGFYTTTRSNIRH